MHYHIYRRYVYPITGNLENEAYATKQEAIAALDAKEANYRKTWRKADITRENRDTLFTVSKDANDHVYVQVVAIYACKASCLDGHDHSLSYASRIEGN